MIRTPSFISKNQWVIIIYSSTTTTTTTTTTPTPTTTPTTTTTKSNLNRESFTEIVTKGHVGWVMDEQQNAYEYFVSIGVNSFQARMISNVQVEHNFKVDHDQNVVIGVKTFLQVQNSSIRINSLSLRKRYAFE